MICPRCKSEASHVDPHHLIYQKELRRWGGDPDDQRNIIPLGRECCHGPHHSRSAVIPLADLPDSVFEFAEELMGPGAAYNYLARTYAGEDPRLDSLLHRWEVLRYAK